MVPLGPDCRQVTNQALPNSQPLLLHLSLCSFLVQLFIFLCLRGWLGQVGGLPLGDVVRQGWAALLLHEGLHILARQLHTHSSSAAITQTSLLQFYEKLAD